MSRNLVIFLHGVGSSGANLAPLGNAWAAALPDTDFAAPDAPFASDMGQGYQWFSVRGVTEENRPGRVLAAREGFDATLAAIIAAHGLTDRLDKVALVGFSQGSIMALDALVSGRWPVAGIVAFSGRLAAPEPFAPSTTTKALLVHGDADRIMAVGESVAAAEKLKALGMDATVSIEPGLGHAISQEGAERAAAFLKHVFG
ncbi:MAG: phospholipase [Shinella sp.]|jgi:phospholipase/carboxylesterase|nr:MAG: phospholipase [Shinella sp.]